MGDTGLELVNCTFAYNVSQGTRAPAGILVGKGTAKIRNSIFYGNTMGKGTNTSCGADLHVCSNATAQIEYSLFSDKTTTNVTEAVGAFVTYGSAGVDNNVYGDPLLVTTASDVLASLSAKVAIPYCTDAVRYTDLAGAARFNAHLRGGAGYYDERSGKRLFV